MVSCCGHSVSSSHTHSTTLMSPRRLWVVKDAAGIVCASMTLGLIVFGEFSVVVMTILPWFEYRITSASILLTFLFNSVLFLALWSHLMALTTDPGTRASFLFYFLLAAHLGEIWDLDAEFWTGIV